VPWAGILWGGEQPARDGLSGEWPLVVAVSKRYARRVRRGPRFTSASAARAWACALSLSAVLALAGVGAPSAMAGNLDSGGALSQLTEGGQEETKTNTTSTTSATGTSSSNTNSKAVILLAMAAAALLLAGIAFVIVRDARRVAPANEADVIEARSAHDTAVRIRKRRAKAKAARQQRKRNR
jgi:hypothetical protein